MTRALVPEDLDFNARAEREASVRAITRACIHSAVGALEARGATSPTTLPNMVGSTDRQLSADWLASLAGASAGASLLASGLTLAFNGAAQILLPSLTLPTGTASFVAEGAPIPVASGTSTRLLLEPRKLAAIVELTSEMLSSGNADTLVRSAMIAAAAASLDEALLDSVAGSASRPPGLRAGISALTASAATPSDKALAEDVSSLISSVSPVSSGQPIAFVGDVDVVAKLKMRVGGFPFPTLPTSAASMSGVLAAVATSCLASAVGKLQIKASRDGVDHRNTVPAQIGTPGSPNTVAAVSWSLWQADSVSLRLIHELAWGLRDSRGCAWLTPGAW